jgi:hypothetical protein
MKQCVGWATTGLIAISIALYADTANAEPVNWEAIAQCESGGNWAADTGNGDYGGLQITEPTWQANGGTAGLPSQASPVEQIAVGKRIMATQGPGAWPTCAGASGAANAPVGSLTNYLTTLMQDV